MDTNTTNGRIEIELEAMRKVAEILSALPDEQTRARVLRWTADRLALPQIAAQGATALEPAAAQARDARPKPEEAVDTSDLNLEGLESLFDGDGGATEKANDDMVGAETGRASRSAAKAFERRSSHSRHSA